MNGASRPTSAELKKLTDEKLVDRLVHEAKDSMEWDNAFAVDACKAELVRRLDRTAFFYPGRKP